MRFDKEDKTLTLTTVQILEYNLFISYLKFNGISYKTDRERNEDYTTYYITVLDNQNKVLDFLKFHNRF